VWKMGPFARGGMNSPEHSNHFADMDKLNTADHKTLLQQCDGHPDKVDVATWQAYYDAVDDESRGLLPFRVWQFFDAMVAYLKAGDVEGFVCAAGVLSHYVGDACQPLHISYMFNGDPDDKVPTPVKNHGVTTTEMLPRAKGVHAAYEDDMVNYHI